MRGQRAFTILEMIVSLAISIPCLLALSIALNQSSKHLIRTKQLKNKVFNSIRIKQLLQGTLDDMDSHTFQIMPKIHKNGVIRYANGSPNKISKYTSSLKPAKQSDAITYLLLDINETQEVLNIQSVNQIINSYSCSRFSTNFKKEDYKAYMLVEPQGFFEAKASQIQVSSQNNQICLTMSLIPQVSMIFQSPQNINAHLIRYIIPIKNIYTLYVDTKGNYRYLGHGGISNIENQPILEKVGTINLTAEPLFTQNFLKLKAIITPPKAARPLEIEISNQLARKSIFNFLLNLP